MTVSVDKKTLKIIFSICVLAVAICIAVCVSEIRATADYSKADGTLVSIDRSIDLGLQNNSKTDIIRYKVYQYQVNQQEYTCQYRTYVLFQPKIGSHKTIYYSSSNPNQVRDEFKIQTAKAGVVFFAFFGIMMSRIFYLQIINGQNYADSFTMRIKRNCGFMYGFTGPFSWYVK